MSATERPTHGGFPGVEAAEVDPTATAYEERVDGSVVFTRDDGTQYRVTIDHDVVTVEKRCCGDCCYKHLITLSPDLAKVMAPITGPLERALLRRMRSALGDIL